MAQRGGRRPGAGRKKGSPNKATIERQKEIADSGLTPLDFMISVMRDEKKPLDVRMDAAYKAAPYVHPKLSNIDHTSKDGTMTPKPNRVELFAVIPDDDGKD